MNQIKRILLTFVGAISLGLGILGIMLPILPTTPFLLLAAFCFVRSSAKLYNWLINHKVLGKYVRNYIEHKAVKKEAKILALVMIWTSVPFCIIFLIPLWPIKILLFLIASAVSIYILRLATYTEEIQEANS